MTQPATVVELLQTLIRIPSVHPAGDPGTPHTGEAGMAAWLADWLKAEFPKAQVELREVLPGRPNLVARLSSPSSASAPKPRLLFAPHTDTVSVAGMTIEPFGAEIRDGKIWGRGASDTKGSMAAMLWALRAERDSLDACSHEIWFTGLCSEEAGQHGALALSAEEKFDFVIAGEPTGLDAVIAHKGALWLTLTTTGKAVHAAEPERGENAIYKMAEALRCIRDVIAPAFAKGPRHPLLGQTTISAGVIHGGSKINIVPDHCTCEVDIRYIPEHADPLGDVTAALKAVCPDIQISHHQTTPMSTPESHPVIQVLKSCGSRCVGAPWFSDAGIFSQRGVPSIAFGPGSIAQAHTKDEFLAVDDLEKGVDFIRRFIRSL